MSKRKNGCYKCTKRYWNCQDECPDKSTGENYKPDDAEYLAYKAQLYFTNKTKEIKRRKH